MSLSPFAFSCMARWSISCCLCVECVCSYQQSLAVTLTEGLLLLHLESKAPLLQPKNHPLPFRESCWSSQCSPNSLKQTLPVTNSFWADLAKKKGVFPLIVSQIGQTLTGGWPAYSSPFSAFAGFCRVSLGYQSIHSCEIIATELPSIAIECKWGKVLCYSGVTSHQGEPPDMPGIHPGPCGFRLEGWLSFPFCPVQHLNHADKWEICAIDKVPIRYCQT